MISKTSWGIFTALFLVTGLWLFFFPRTDFEMIRGAFWLTISGFCLERALLKSPIKEEKTQ